MNKKHVLATLLVAACSTVPAVRVCGLPLTDALHRSPLGVEERQEGLGATADGDSASVPSRTLTVKRFRHAGPFTLRQPVHLDSTDVQGKPFDEAALLSAPLRLEAVHEGELFNDDVLAKDAQGQPVLHLLAFTLTNTSFVKAQLDVKALFHHQLFLDGKAVKGGNLELLPATHEVILKVLTTSASTDSVLVTLTPRSASSSPLSLSVPSTPHKGVATDTDTSSAGRLYTLDDVLHARRYGGLSLSPDGRWMIVSTMQVQPGGQTDWQTEVRDVVSGRVVEQRKGIHWMPRTSRYYYTRTQGGHRQLVTTDPQTLSVSVLATDLPEGHFDVVPTEDRLIYTITDEGPTERADVYEVIHPDDRQPGWRHRSHLAIYDLRTGLMQPLTFGHERTYLADISSDGRFALVHTSRSCLGQRPTERASCYRIDLTTLAVDTLFREEGFVGTGRFSPDARQVLFSGSPEAFEGIGLNVLEGQTPSMIDTQLFIMDIDSRHVRPLTRDFDPNVGSCVWHKADGMIYFSAEDKDSVNLFCMDPVSGRCQRFDLPEELVGNFALAADAPLMAFYAQSASNSDRLYTLDPSAALRKGRKAIRLSEDLSAETLHGITLGACEPYVYTNEQGEHISCRYYLPPHFDATRRYPMIVNYYGGCSPTSRNFESRYPQHAYAALGYVVLVINPRGATGFGQQWSAQHVNTAGAGVAEDIIGAVKAFCRDHSWVNDKRIGCIGASYGGFMTQYLQTQTDIFAAAISHAGISDHTSYWGEGYWGYSYSEVSMANSYPWTRRDLYVEQSPLFNADKIHTPLLFIHGDADHNVPVGESIQMYTALKLLGRPTAMVLVKNQDHHIQDYTKRQRWQYTIWAWFARWLQDDPSWWQSMYPDKDL